MDYLLSIHIIATIIVVFYSNVFFFFVFVSKILIIKQTFLPNRSDLFKCFNFV